MSQDAGRDAKRKRRFKKKQNAVRSDAQQNDPVLQAGAAQLKGIAALEHLRDRVEAAAREIRRLHEENTALTERIRELEAQPVVEDTQLSLDHDPQMLRKKINGFISAIDQYLEKERTRG